MKKVIFLTIVFVLLPGCSKDKTEDNKYINIENNIIEHDDSKVEIINEEDIIIKNNDTIVDNKFSNGELINTSSIKSEDDVVNYFVKLKDEIKNKVNSDTWENVKESMLEVLEKIYGFCFKKEEIGGYTLAELSDSAKKKVLNIVFEIDDYLENISPGYKELFKDSYNNMIDNTKKSLDLIKDKISNVFKKN